MRVYRLDEPTQMHFDEVYHARTATEFLQDWRYGIPHDIYEWTHPMLAKYAIAGGITLFSDDKVTATGNLSVPVKDVSSSRGRLHLADRRPQQPRRGSGGRYGDRVFVATGSDVRVYDLADAGPGPDVRRSPAPRPSRRWAPTGLLYVGTVDGRIYVIDTNSLDDVQNGLAASVSRPWSWPSTPASRSRTFYAGTPPFILAADARATSSRST